MTIQEKVREEIEIRLESLVACARMYPHMDMRERIKVWGGAIVHCLHTHHGVVIKTERKLSDNASIKWDFEPLIKEVKDE